MKIFRYKLLNGNFIDLYPQKAQMQKHKRHKKTVMSSVPSCAFCVSAFVLFVISFFF